MIHKYKNERIDSLLKAFLAPQDWENNNSFEENQNTSSDDH